jgi:hypothetical protein
MGNSWTDDTADAEESDESDGSTEEETGSAFELELKKAARGSDSMSDIGELQLVNNLEEIDDVQLLKDAWIETSGEKANLIKNRVEELDGEMPEESSDESDDGSEGEPDSGEEQQTLEESTEEAEEDDSDDSGSGWGGSSDESGESSEAAQPSVESMGEMEDDSPEEEEETEETSSQPASGGPPAPSSSVSVQEAAERDRRWKVMVWGPPKLFKTHFCYTMPGPIAYLDLEGKADDLARKFSDKEVQIWQPKDMTAEPDTKFRRAKKALDEALEWLDWWKENEDRTGTIVVDSMSLVWEWAQIHHKIENYPLKEPEDIDLSANFQSSQESDWAVVKEYHNGEFRERITDSDYHFAWTAMERVDFEKTFDDDSSDSAQFMEPRGESTNHYKADTVIRARKDSERGKVGDLVGSNFTDNVFVGMKKPTFPKVRDAVEAIEKAESSENSQSKSTIADQIDAETIIDYDPQMYVNQ